MQSECLSILCRDFVEHCIVYSFLKVTLFLTVSDLTEGSMNALPGLSLFTFVLIWFQLG